MIKILDFDIKHLDEMNVREHELKMMEDYDIGDCLVKSDRCGTIEISGQKVACVGIAGVDVWIVPTQDMHKYRFHIARTIMKLMEGYPYLRTLCLKDRFHARWMGFLGFEPLRDIDMCGHHYCLYERSV